MRGLYRGSAPGHACADTRLTFSSCAACCQIPARRPSSPRPPPSTSSRAAHDDRPYTVTNFALTVDGRATIAGRSGAIGTDTDTAMLVGLRTRVDAIMIGAGTMRAERYGRVVGDPEKRARRERAGSRTTR